MERVHNAAFSLPKRWSPTVSTDPECLFCKIVAGQIPSFRICEDDDSFAFMDINPANPGHALVVPKRHCRDLHAIDTDDLAAVAKTAQRVARAVHAALAPPGMNLMQCNGEAAGQSVFHFHMHVMPRAMDDGLAMNWGIKPGDMGEIEATCEQIKSCLEEA